MTDQPDYTPAVQQSIKENYRWNFTVNALDGAFFWLGMSFFSSTIILPLFVRHFTDNSLAIGMISFLGWAAVLVPQIFTANLVFRNLLPARRSECRIVYLRQLDCL